jgi:histidine ammonia-lyase
VVRHTRAMLAIEALAAARALDMLRPLRSSTPLEQARERIRAVSPAFDGDRALHQDIAAIEGLIGDGKLRL